jgi:hypothetical protein
MTGCFLATWDSVLHRERPSANLGIAHGPTAVGEGDRTLVKRGILDAARIRLGQGANGSSRRPRSFRSLLGVKDKICPSLFAPLAGPADP